MRGLVEFGLVAVLLTGAGGCPGGRPEPEDWLDAGLDGDARVDEDPRTEVPHELVGTWQSGSIDFVRWENYKQGYWAGRNAIPSREAMTFRADGSAKFYRYEFAF